MYETIMGDIIGDRFEFDGSHLDNTLIKEAVDKCYNNRNEENMFNVLDTLLTRIKEGGKVIVPMVDQNHVMDTFVLEQDIRFTIDSIQDGQGKLWIPLFTDEEEIDKGQMSNIRMNLDILDMFNSTIKNEHVQGMVINPFGQYLVLPKDIVKIILKLYEQEISHN